MVGESARVENYANPDLILNWRGYGDCMITGKMARASISRVDAGSLRTGLRTWGMDITLIAASAYRGILNFRKYINVGDGEETTSDVVFLVDGQSEKRFDVHGKVGFPFFGQLILDCMNRTRECPDAGTLLQGSRIRACWHK